MHLHAWGRLRLFLSPILREVPLARGGDRVVTPCCGWRRCAALPHIWLAILICQLEMAILRRRLTLGKDGLAWLYVIGWLSSFRRLLEDTSFAILLGRRE
jgi:hypothetical protein